MDSDRHRTDSPCGEKVELLQARLGHVRKENENLRHLVEVMKNQCNVLQARVLETTVRSRDDHGNNDGVKHAVPVGVPMESAAKKTSRIFVKADSKDSGALTVEDGYQWRKYGQKVTKDNPSSPRAYFRCSMAPSGCPVKKKVQRLLEDRSFIVANYQGEHNHDVPHCSSLGRSSSSANYRSPPMGKNTCCPDRQTAESITRGSDVTLDLTLSGSNQETRPCKNLVMRAVCDNKMKIEDYVASLTTDPTFTLALAKAVAASITEQLPSPQ